MTIIAILQNKGSEVVTVEVGTSVRDAVARLAERRIGAMPVCDRGRVAGIVSERDVIHHLSSEGADILDRPVETIMTSPAIMVPPDKEVMGALSLMTQRRVRHLPVVENESIVGIVSIGDLVKFRMDQIEQEAEALLTYIQTA